MAKVRMVLGSKWGDEGKGKVIAYFAKFADLTIRATGGNNAGHTIYIDGEEFKLHLMPSGISSSQCMCLIGQGTVIDFDDLFWEIESVGKKIGIDNVMSRLRISGTASVVLPYHKSLDKLHEKMRGKKAIGTTLRGIGPAYADKTNRNGLKVYDLLQPVEVIEEKIALAVKLHNILFKACDMEECVVDPHELAKKCAEIGKKIASIVVDGRQFVKSYLECADANVLVEGAQATRLSIEWGDYPNCTSSDPNTAGTATGAHLAIDEIDEVIGVAKAYDTRVGNGPFPTEYKSHINAAGKLEYYDEADAYIGDRLRDIGREYGATTRRPRRCGGFDGIVAKHSAEIGSYSAFAITRIDTLGEFGEAEGSIQIAIAYEYKNQIIDYFPDDLEYSGEMPKPRYITIDGGWRISPDMKSYEDLPAQAKFYIKVIEDITGTPVKYIGTGPRNEDLIVRDEFDDDDAFEPDYCFGYEDENGICPFGTL